MVEAYEKTQLLPPSTAVKIAWAQTGFLPTNSPESKDIATEAKKNLDDTKRRAVEKGDPEMSYVTNAAIDIASTMRTLDTIYKGRALNIAENDKLRGITLENIQDTMTFGNSAKDFIKSLPAMAITSGAGTITLNQVLESLKLPTWSLWLIGLGMAGVGYIINLFFVWNSRRAKQQLFVRQDYERDMFYSQYITRVRTALINLYNDIDRLHINTFKNAYPIGESENATTIVDDLLKGAQPTMCKRVHEHMNNGVISPGMWSICETCGNAIEFCKYNK